MEPTYRRFFLALGATAAAVVGVFWLAAAWLPIGFMPQEYAMGEARRQLLAQCQRPSLVIQGDSRPAAGLIPSRLGPETVNLSFGGSTPLEVYYFSQKILACGSAPRRVLLNISPQLFMKPPYFWDRTALFGWLSFDQMEEVRRLSRRYGDTTFYGAAKFGDWEAVLENALHAVSFPSYYTSYIANHLVVGRMGANRAVLERTRSSLGQHGYGRDNGSADLADEADIHTFVPSPVLNAYMDRLLDNYATHGTRVDFVAVPLNRATYDRLKPGVVDDFQAYLDQLAARHPNFHLLGHAIEWRDNAWFGDSTHLNTFGAERFSDEVQALLARGH